MGKLKQHHDIWKTENDPLQTHTRMERACMAAPVETKRPPQAIVQ
jgi:hypothetical protein